MTKATQRYRSLSSWLKEQFGEPVRKIALDAGLGCPNRDGTIGTGGCVYCNPRGSGTGARAHGMSIAEQVERGVAFLSRRYGCRKFLAYYQSFTNTYGDPERLRSLYGEALTRPEIVGLAVGTRPDCASDAVLDVLGDIAADRLVWVEYGLQSIHRKTLDLINRGHGPEAFFDAAARTRSRGIGVVVHLILGLPGESLQDMVTTAEVVAGAGIQGVKLHPLYVVRGTELERMFRSGLYEPLTMEQAVEAVLAVLDVLPPEVIVHRMTSDPHAEELIAPEWTLDRKKVRAFLEAKMEADDFRQGARWMASNRQRVNECEKVRQRGCE